MAYFRICRLSIFIDRLTVHTFQYWNSSNTYICLSRYNDQFFFFVVLFDRHLFATYRANIFTFRYIKYFYSSFKAIIGNVLFFKNTLLSFVCFDFYVFAFFLFCFQIFFFNIIKQWELINNAFIILGLEFGYDVFPVLFFSCLFCTAVLICVCTDTTCVTRTLLKDVKVHND